ncbi:MAG: hypothetical protein CML02_13545 [Pseudooceanicola sp.]|jgi:hypothetical protein|nr:hypothetical protein [Pseudooceanicola sp.]
MRATLIAITRSPKHNNKTLAGMMLTNATYCHTTANNGLKVAIGEKVNPAPSVRTKRARCLSAAAGGGCRSDGANAAAQAGLMVAMRPEWPP